MSKRSLSGDDNFSKKEKLSLSELYQLKYDVVLDLYRRRARRLEAVAIKEHNSPLLDSWEYYIYKLFGSRLVGSLAFSLDPYWQTVDISKKEFGVPKKFIDTLAPIVVTPVNRHRKFPTILAYQTLFKENKYDVISSNGLVWNNPGWSMSGMKSQITNQDYSTTGGLPAQLPCYGWIHDTTWKTRNPGSKTSYKTTKTLPQSQGEYELFVPRIEASGCSYGYMSMDSRQSVSQAVGTGLYAVTTEQTKKSGHATGPVAVVLDSDLQTFYAAEHIYGRSVMVSHLDKMMAQCVPNRRYFNLAYQIGELKDVPMSIRSTLHSWRSFQLAIGKEGFIQAYLDSSWWTRDRAHKYSSFLKKMLPGYDADKELAAIYLNFKFGWESLFSAIKKLLSSPVRAAKDINDLCRRNGKFSNLSYQINWSEGLTSPLTLYLPTGTFILSPHVDNPAGITGRREVTLRLVVNSGINFPECDGPSFRWKLFLDHLGLVPTPADAYDLIPWTWLIDWFTGASDYIHLMDRVNGNKSPINYGLITYKSLTRVTGSQKLYGQSTVGWKNVPPDLGTAPLHTSTYDNCFNFSGSVVLKYELRLSVASLINVSTYSGQNLTADQITILGALSRTFSK